MKQIIELTKREIKTHFYSPVGWLMITVFAIHVGFMLGGRIDGAVSFANSSDSDVNNYSLLIFSSLFGFFRLVASNFYLYVPLITMGVFSNEFSNGGIKLLYSSPLTTLQIVLGKFIPLVIYTLFMMIIIIVYVVLTRLFLLDSLDFSMIFSGMVQCFLVLTMLTSIGLFISSLTSYQLVAAAGTFAIFFVMNNFLGGLVQPHHPQVLQLLFGVWLPPNLHIDGYGGLVKLGDLIYFISITLLFVALTYLRLSYIRESGKKLKMISNYTILTCLILVFGLWTYAPKQSIYYDFTDKKLKSPSMEQESVQSRLESPLKFKKYYNILENPNEGSYIGYFGTIKTLDRLRNSIKIKPEIELIPFYAHTENLNPFFLTGDSRFDNALDLATQTPRQLSRSSKSMDLDSLVAVARRNFSWLRNSKILGLMEIAEDLDTTKRQFYDLYVLNNNDLNGTLRIGTLMPNDQTFTTAVKVMIDKPVNIRFSSGNYERSPEQRADTDYFRLFNDYLAQYSMVNQGFNIKLIDLNNYCDLEKNEILVLADPQKPLNSNGLECIYSHYESGGNMIVLGSQTSLSNLNDIINHFGMNIAAIDTVINYSAIKSKIVRDLNDETGILENDVLIYSRRLPKLTDRMGNGTVFTTPNVNEVLIKEEITEFEYFTIAKAEEFTTIMGLKRNIFEKEQRIVIAGNADFLSNGVEGIGFHSAYGSLKSNYAVAFSLFRWLSNDKYPVKVERKQQNEKLKSGYASLLKTLLLLVVSVPMVITGIVILYRRNREISI